MKKLLFALAAPPPAAEKWRQLPEIPEPLGGRGTNFLTDRQT